MIGKTISAVTLDHGALSENYLKIALASRREPNRLVDIRIGDIYADGLIETGALAVLA